MKVQDWLTKDGSSKILMGASAMLAWFYLVLTGQAPVDDFVEMLQGILVSVGIYHVALRNPKE